MNSKHILITGASGLIGTRLTELLLHEGYSVAHLSRSKKGEADIQTFQWNVDNGWIESGAFEGVDAIIHLAGAGIGDKPWTEKRKQEIIDSRVKSSALLHQELGRLQHNIKSFISASGVSFYGTSESEVFIEADEPGGDFLAYVTCVWEREVNKISTLGIRVAELRTGLVLSNRGGILDKFIKPIRWYVGASLGTGNQWMSWIHIDDLCRMYIHAIERNDMQGPYNAVAPELVTNKTFVKAIASALHKPVWLPPVPSFFLKLLLGEMVYLAVEGSRISCEKIQKTGFHFEFEKLSDTLDDLFNKARR